MFTHANEAKVSYECDIPRFVKPVVESPFFFAYEKGKVKHIC